jgi:mannose-6-phosphate isomerase-like protein (cupin superfamily)
MKTTAVLVLALVLGLGGAQFANGQATPQQKPPAAPAQPPAGQPPAAQPPAVQKPAAPKPRPASRLTLTVFVTDPTGAPQAGVKVTADGPVPREGTTSREGSITLQGLRPGNYRLHFEADRFVTFEKEVVLKGSEEIEVTLTKTSAPPKPDEPPPAPKPAPSAAATPPPPDPNATVAVLSIPDYIEKNKIVADGSQVAASGDGVALVLEVDRSRERSHADVDEYLYVIAGQGTLRSKGRDQSLDAGMLILVPRGVGYTIAPRGRRAMYALSVLTGPTK